MLIQNASLFLERTRLQLLEQMLDPLTRRHLAALGLAPGWRCLEAGSGAGSIARWLAEQVGPSGRAVAADIEPGLAGLTGLPQLEVRRHDILRDALEPGAYDLAHCRALLMHLRTPAEAAANMAKALKPGGWLLAEEFDASGCRALAEDARGLRFNELTRRINSSLRDWGVMDIYVGQRLDELLANAGLVNIKVEKTHPERRGGDAASRFQEATLALLAPLVGAGVIAEADREFLGACYRDPAFRYRDYILTAAQGQRAAG